VHPIVLVAFILSGISGLTLEIVWTRMLEHVFGATTLAISTVLTCFMGGLALGSWLLGRFADRLRNPLRVYAVAEGVVGLCALAVPWLIQNVYPDLNRWMVRELSGSFWSYSLVRFAAVAVVLIIPTTCMGATLPLLSRHVIRHRGHMLRVGRRVGLLYALNTLGAIGGVFLAVFALLPRIGLGATNTLAAGINLTLCAAILILLRRLGPRDTTAADESGEDLEIAAAVEGFRDFSATARERWMTLLAFFLSGLASMNLQVVWNRSMAMVIGSSVYSFALVLLAFLVGLAAGAAVFSHLGRRFANPVVALALVELCIAAAAMGNYLYMDDLPELFARLVTSNIDAYEEHVALVQFIMFGVAALAVLPATFFMGATFPLTIRIATSDLARLGRDVGGVYALNTLGAIIGSFLSAFVFVPLFSRWFGGVGMQATFFLSTAIYVAIGAGLLLVSRLDRLTRLFATVPVAALAALFFLVSPAWDAAAMTIGVFRLSLMENALDEESWGAPDIKYYHDGVTTTVSIELWGRHFALKNNGKVDASNGDDMPTQIVVAAYPLLFHPRGPVDLEVAIIGFGSGVTVGSALQFPVRQVDTVELESAVVAASVVFGSVEGEPADPELAVNHLVYRAIDAPAYDWSDPDTFVIDDRLRIFNNDGRNFLASAEKQYDVIISEPSNPWITGVANMFTAESFASSAAALAPGGVFGQWVQLYELSPENIRIIFRTFASVFPHVALLAAEDLSSDTVLLGSFEPLGFDLGRIGRAMGDPRVAAELERAYLLSPADVLARVLLVDREELLAYTDGAGPGRGEPLPINTDDNALIEFAAPRDLISFKRFAGYLATIYTAKWRFGRLSRVLTGFGEGEAAVRDLADQALSLLGNGRKGEAARMLELAAGIDPAHRELDVAREVARLLAGEGASPARPEVKAPFLAGDEERGVRRELEEHVAGVTASLEQGAHRDARERFARIPDHLWRRGGPQLLLLKGYLHFLGADPEDTSECEEAIEILEQLAREHDRFVLRHPEIHYWLGLCHDNVLHFDKAVKHVRAYVEARRVQEALDRITRDQALADLEAAIAGLSGTAAIALPPDAPDAPTTDLPGESPKDLHTGLATGQ
jgi:spermidine synthase